MVSTRSRRPDAPARRFSVSAGSLLIAVVGALLLLPSAALAQNRAAEQAVASNVSGNLLNQDRWMGELADEAGGGTSALNQTLAQFVFPGSHDSGTYTFPLFNPLDPFNRPPTGCARCIPQDVQQVLDAPALGLLVSYQLVPFAKAQDMTVAQQLLAGVRAFDLKFFRAIGEAGLTPGQFYTHRWFAGASSTTIFNDIKTFLDTPGHTKEILLLNFSRMYTGAGDMPAVDLLDLFLELRSVVGQGRFAVRTLGDSTTLAQLSALGKQVIVTYDGPTSTVGLNIDLEDIIWPPTAGASFASPTPERPAGGYPNAVNWKTEPAIFDAMQRLASQRTNTSTMFRMFVNMGPDNDGFPDMIGRGLVCNLFQIVDEITDPIDKISGLLETKAPVEGTEPTNWEKLKTTVKDAVKDAVVKALAAAAVEAALDLAGVCPAINDDWDRFTSLEDVAGFTNPKLLPSLVGLPRDQVNIVLSDYYPAAFTAEAKRLNRGAARLSVIVREIQELHCHDCLPPSGPSDPDYYPEISFLPKLPDNTYAPADWPTYDVSKEILGVDLNPGHASHWGGPWLETTGTHIAPSWRAFRSVDTTTPNVEVWLKTWDQDNNYCPDPAWCGADDESQVAGEQTTQVVTLPVWDGGQVELYNVSGQTSGPTGLTVFDSSRVSYTYDVCQWSQRPGQTSQAATCAPFHGNTPPVAVIDPAGFNAYFLEGNQALMLGAASYDNDPLFNSDLQPVGRIVSYEWDCAYAAGTFVPGRGCDDAIVQNELVGGAAVGSGIIFRPEDGPKDLVVALRVTDAGGLSGIATHAYHVNNASPVATSFTVTQELGSPFQQGVATFTDAGLDDFDPALGLGTCRIIVPGWGILFGGITRVGPTIVNNQRATKYSCRSILNADLPSGTWALVLEIVDKDLAPGGPELQQQVAVVLPPVTSVDEYGLRGIISRASAGDTITFHPSLSGATITVTKPILVGRSVTIDASALPGGLVISGNNASQVFVINQVPGVVTLKGLTITRGVASRGGCIFTSSALTLIDSTVTGCAATTQGGGVFGQFLSITRSTISGNSAPEGGGLYVAWGLSTIVDSTISGNSADHGGGIATIYPDLRLTNTTIAGNVANIDGGGFYSFGPAGYTATLVHSTVSANRAMNTTSLACPSCSTGAGGGGIFALAGTVAFENSIVAGNKALWGSDLMSWTGYGFAVSGPNLIGNNHLSSQIFQFGPLIGWVLEPLDARLAPLGYYGGRTKTMPLLAGSPAIDAATVTGNSPPADQRGFTRPIGAASDLGAVEGVTAQAIESVQNGGFTGDASNWLQHATPNPSYIVSNVTNDVFQFYRNAPPPGTSNQAVVFQNTGLSVGSGGWLEATFDLGNSMTTRKRISVLIHDGDFSDLSVCTFYLDPSTPLNPTTNLTRPNPRAYRMRTHTTKAWTNTTISFYAASAGQDGGGFYQLDNVSLLNIEDAGSATGTDCVDPTAPAGGGASSGNLITNGAFDSGLAPWGTFGQILSIHASGLFSFLKLAGTPSGVVLQATGAAMTDDERLVATLKLGNSSAIRQRVTVLVHDNDFSDLAACTFWLAPGQPLSDYGLRMFATKAWTSATVSVYPATVGTQATAGWLRLDNVTLARTAAAALGTECSEPGGTNGAPAPAGVVTGGSADSSTSGTAGASLQ